MNTDFKIEEIEGRKICIGGIGKLFYQDGFPISLSVSKFKSKGIEVSILHVADECLKNGWSAKTTLNKLKADLSDDIDGNIYDIPLLEKFIYSTYEEQREVIFQYLFGGEETAKSFLRDKIK